MTRWVQRHPIFSFSVFAYLYSWLIAVPLALQEQRIVATHLPFALHYLTAFGPALSVLTITRFVRRGTAETEFAALHPRRKSAKWLIVGFASPLLLFASAQVLGRVVGQPTPTWMALGKVNFLPELGLGSWLLWFFTSGIGEETGWRGFALPLLQRKHSPLASSILLGLIWGGWHLPAFYYLPSYAALGFRIVPGFFIGVLAGSIVLTWLYNSSGGSVLSVVLWHASFNFVSASPNASGLAAAVTSVLVIGWALFVVWRYGAAMMSSRSVGSRMSPPFAA